MGYREYARHRECTLAAVQKALADGRIQAVVDGDGRKKIDSATADTAWALNTDPGKRSPLFSDGPAPGAAGAADAVVSAAHTSAPAPPADPLDDDLGADTADASDAGEPADPPESGTASPEYRKARTEREQLRVQKERFEFDQLQGKYVLVADVSRAVFTSFRTLRDRVLNTSARLKHQLAAEMDAERVERILDEELAAALVFDPKTALAERDLDDDDEVPE